MSSFNWPLKLTDENSNTTGLLKSIGFQIISFKLYSFVDSMNIILLCGIKINMYDILNIPIFYWLKVY